MAINDDNHLQSSISFSINESNQLVIGCIGCTEGQEITITKTKTGIVFTVNLPNTTSFSSISGSKEPWPPIIIGASLHEFLGAKFLVHPQAVNVIPIIGDNNNYTGTATIEIIY